MTTIAKVAERAGVSRTTVSHVINHADRVSAHLRKRELDAIDELGYVPNPQAQSLRTGKTNLVALIIPDIRNPFFPELVRTAQIDLERAGFDTMVFNSDTPGGHALEHSREYLRQIRARRIDGLILYDFAFEEAYDELRNVGIPMVYIGHLPLPIVDNVRADDYRCAYDLARRLLDLGHRRIAHVTGPQYFREAVARRRGFEDALRAAGIEQSEELTFEGDYLPDSGQRAIEWLFDLHARELPTAIFFANLLMAMTGLAALYDRGIRVPEEMTVAVFGDQPLIHHLRPRMLNQGVSPKRLAQAACTLLRSRLDGSYAGPPRVAKLDGAGLEQLDNAGIQEV